MATIDILGVYHAYELTAPTQSPHVLVFIHGWLLSRSYWQPLIDELSSEYQCLSYDLRGFGGSKTVSPAKPIPPESRVKDKNTVVPSLAALDSAPLPTDRRERTERPLPLDATALLSHQGVTAKYTSAAYAQDLEVLLHQLGITSAWLIGHSLGGSIGLWAAKRMGSVVKGVVCVNSGGGIYLKEEFERFRSIGQRILRFRPVWLAYLPLVDLLFSRTNVFRPIERRWGRQRVVDFVAAHPEAALGALLDPTTEVEVHLLPRVVADIKQPVYFIAGKQDSIMEPKYVHHLASFHPMFQSGVSVIEIPNCGHLAMVEQPTAIATHLRSILCHSQGSVESEIN